MSGKVVYSGPETQILLRLIETETGRISASFTETFGSAVSPSVIAAKVSDLLLPKIESLYPLRGRIAAVGESGITLNIGQKAGVKVGRQLRVRDTDAVLEVVAVQPDSGTAKAVKGGEALQQGMMFEAM
jgi:hypothetical protein